MIRLSPQLRAGIQRSTLPFLILLSGAIVLIGKSDQTMFDTLRTGLSDAAAPVLDVMARPLGAVEAALDRARGLFGIYQENRRLVQDNERLLQWQQIALKLTTENRQLQGLLKVVPDRAVSYVTARVIANSGGAYVRTVMINAGTDGGLARGQATITGDGLVGRLTEVGSRAARVLLITDLNSRIPVRIEGSHTSAVLAGDNSERPRLLYVAATEGVKIGDRVVHPKGSLLTLTAQEATEKINGKPLLADGIADSVEDLARKAGLKGPLVSLDPSGFERLAFWITKLAPLLLLLGIICAYLEFKIPGASLPGIIAAFCFALFFLGHYLAGLAGWEAAPVSSGIT